jgi:hypothetical protein
MYDDATAEIQFNGTTVGKISKQCAVRQGFPLSMALCAFCIHPFLRMLNDNIRGYKFERRQQSIRVTAFADDVTVFLTDPRDFELIRQAIFCFEASSGARVNTNKSCAVASRTWETSQTLLNIPYREHTNILDFHTAKTVREAAEGSWRKMMRLIRAHAQGSYGRKMSLDRKILYMHTYLLARAWYITQIYPAPQCIVRQVNTTIEWFIWKGDIFRVPLTTLYRNKRDGGWELIDCGSKCQTFFL